MLRTGSLILIALLLGTSVFGAPPVQNGLVLDLDASSLTGYTNGQTVPSWPDLAVADGNANNATSTGTPTYVSNAINGKPIIRIDGTSDSTGTSLPAQHDFYSISPTVKDVKTIALVFKPTSNTYYTWAPIMSGPTSDDYGWHGDTHWGNAYWDYSYTIDSINNSTLIIDGNSNAAPSGGGYKGVDYDNFHVVIIKLADGSTPFNLGFLAHTARYNGDNEYGMQIAELLVYNRHITDVEENKIGYYLTGKYGIATTYTADPIVGDPSPADKDGGLSVSGTTLTWDVANGTSPKATVWFGSQGNMTQRATGLAAHSWTTPALSPDTVYEWRIDLVDGGRTFPGPVWSFRTILSATKVIDWGLESTSSAAATHQSFIVANHITATASGEVNGWASSTLSDDGLYGMGHIAYPYGYSWISDLYGGENLHPVDGSDNYNWGAWIEYTFDTAYTIGNMYIWNHNQNGLTNRGLKNVTIQYSVNGTTWSTLGSYVIPRATGLNGMTPSATINFAGASAKYVVITAALIDGQYGPDPGVADTYYALAKVRFGMNGTTATDVTTPDSAGYLSSGNGIVKGSPQIVQGMSTGDNCMSFTGDTDAVVSNILGSSFPAAASQQWSMNFYVYLDEELNQYDIVAGFGTPENFPDGARRCIMNYGHADGTHGNQIYFWGQSEDLATNVPFDIAQWQMITTTYDGANLQVYKNGILIASKKTLGFVDAVPVMDLGVKCDSYWDAGKFKGKIDNLTIYKGVLSQSEITTLAQALPLTGNFNKDASVNFKDFAVFGQRWMTNAKIQQWPTMMLLDMEGANALSAWSVSAYNTGVATIKLISGDASNTSDPNQPFAGSQAVRMTYDNTGNNKWSAVDVNLPATVDMTKYDVLRIHLKRHIGNSREEYMYYRGYAPDGHQLFDQWETTYSTDTPAGVWELEDGANNGNIVLWCDWFPFAHQLAKLEIGVRGTYAEGMSGGTGTIDIDNIQLEKFDNCLGTITEGDFNADCVIDFKDVVFFANNWLRSE
jgi:hypothetical protein